MTDERSFLRRLVVAIDGPAGSGKTTTARGVARTLGLRHVDTGAMYRAVTWKTLETGTDPSDETRVAEISRAIDIAFSQEGTGAEKIAADGIDVSDAIRTLEVTRHVSLVSSYPAVRRSMVRLQRHLARDGGVVLEGRDIGSVVLPGAHVKVFLQASVDERANRRLRELAAKGVEKTFEEIRADMERRDRLDSTRETSPLKIAVGAHVVDTTSLSIEEEVRKIVEIARDTASSLSTRVIPKGEKNPHASPETDVRGDVRGRAVYRESALRPSRRAPRRARPRGELHLRVEPPLERRSSHRGGLHQARGLYHGEERISSTNRDSGG